MYRACEVCRKKKAHISNCVCVYVCVWVGVCICACKNERWKRSSVGLGDWLLGIRLRCRRWGGEVGKQGGVEIFVTVRHLVPVARAARVVPLSAEAFDELSCFAPKSKIFELLFDA